MTAPNTKRLAVALLVMVGAFSLAPTSQAEPKHGAAISSAQGSSIVAVAFSYDRTAPALEIYSDLRRTADAACTSHGIRSIVIRRLEQRCARTMIESGIAQLDRSDIAQLHRGRIAVANR
jgi:hypothetical protein